MKFELLLTEREFASPKRRKHCTQKCASHLRKHSEISREKTRQSLLGRPSHKKGTGGQEQTCNHCSVIFKTQKTKTPRKFCTNECYKLFHKDKRTERENFKCACQFKFNVYDYPDNFDLSLIAEHGWYRASNRGNNLNGVSRDHMLSIAEAFKRGIDPELIAHPANCALVLHRLNQRKNTKSTITVEELQQRITQFSSRYPSS